MQTMVCLREHFKMNIEDIRPNLYLENLSPGEVAKVLYPLMSLLSR